MLERRFPLQWIAGEISNLRPAASGHLYFTIKDEAAQVDCVMFKSRAARLDWEPADGLRVEVRALVTLYEPRGRFQLNVEAMRRAGLGPAVRALPAAEGQARARGPVRPAARSARSRSYPTQIGVVTSLAAAALRDVLTTLRRRNPSIPVVVYPAPVQGEGAAAKLAQALAAANRARRMRRAAAGARRRLDRGPVAVQRRGARARDPRLATFRSSSASATRPTSPSPISPPTSARRRRPRPPNWSARRATRCSRASRRTRAPPVARNRAPDRIRDADGGRARAPPGAPGRAPAQLAPAPGAPRARAWPRRPRSI